MKNHVSKTVASCFCVVRQLRSISRSVTSPVLRSLAVSLVLSRLDYCNAVLAGLPRYLLDRMQSVLNAAARLVCSARKYDPVTPLLCDLHWLRVPDRIDFKLAVLVYRCIHGMAPPYLAGDLCRVADIPSQQWLRSASTAALVVSVSRCPTIGDWSFQVAVARIWNALPVHVTSSPSLLTFKRQLKTELFHHSFSA